MKTNNPKRKLKAQHGGSLERLVRCRKVVSKKYPPTEDCYIESRFEHRSGYKIIYVRGMMPLGMGDWEEIGWCPHCACEYATYAGDTCLKSTYPPHFYELGGINMHPCKTCQPKRDKVLALKAEISALNRKIMAIADEIEAQSPNDKLNHGGE